MQTYRPIPGLCARPNVSKMIEMAFVSKVAVSASFGDFNFTVSPTDTLDDAMERYNLVFEVHEAIREAKLSVSATIAEIDRSWRARDTLMVELETLDFTDLAVVMHWLEKVYGSNKGTRFPASRIVAKFRDNGFAPSENPMAAFTGADEKAWVLWVVGQTLGAWDREGRMDPQFSDRIAIWRGRYRWKKD